MSMIDRLRCLVGAHRWTNVDDLRDRNGPGEVRDLRKGNRHPPWARQGVPNPWSPYREF